MPTMKDVAKLAGVSVGSVSHVINGRTVKKETYQKVMDAINELNYEANNFARGFKKNRTYTIALIIPTIWHPFFAELAYYIESYLQQDNYQLLLCNSTANPDKEIEYISMLRGNKIDGIIAITYSDIEKYVESSLPFVSIDRHFIKGVNVVASDNYKGGYLAAETLVKKGCKRLLFMGSHNKYQNETMQRKNGFESYCKEHQIDYRLIDLLEPDQNYRFYLDELIVEGYQPDGIFTINDYLGLDVMQMLAKYQLKVLEDYQLIGFDGIRMGMERDYLVSTIVQPLPAIAKAAVEILYKTIEDPDYKEQRILPVTYVEGGTTRA